MDYRDLASELLKAARAAGADAADMIVSEGTEFSVTVRKGEVETLTEAGSKALGLRVFVGQAHGLDLHLGLLLADACCGSSHEAVGMARATSEDAAAGLPDELVPARGRRARALRPVAARAARRPSGSSGPGAPRRPRSRSRASTNSQGASWGSGEGSLLLANTRGFMGGYRTSSVSLSVVPQAERDGQMERDHWYTIGPRLADLESPSRWGARPPSAPCGGSARAR